MKQLALSICLIVGRIYIYHQFGPNTTDIEDLNLNGVPIYLVSHTNYVPGYPGCIPMIYKTAIKSEQGDWRINVPDGKYTLYVKEFSREIVVDKFSKNKMYRLMFKN